MNKCDQCRATILFGGIKAGPLLYCNEYCCEQGLLALFKNYPQDEIDEQVYRIHSGYCAKCGRAGPVDVYASYTRWGALFYGNSRTNPEMCCYRCGIFAKLYAIAFSFGAGWWQVPEGLIMTPVQISRNIIGLLDLRDRMRPSKRLEATVRLRIARQLAETMARDDIYRYA